MIPDMHPMDMDFQRQPLRSPLRSAERGSEPVDGRVLQEISLVLVARVMTSRQKMLRVRQFRSYG